MSAAVKEKMEQIYQSLHNNNEGLDERIAELKAVAGNDEVPVDRARLPQNNRQGRKMMQTYFRVRGVKLSFPE